MTDRMRTMTTTYRIGRSRFSGRCSLCGRRIERDAEIAIPTSRGHGRSLHADCLTDEQRRAADFQRQQDGERAMEEAMERAYAGETQSWQ